MLLTMRYTIEKELLERCTSALNECMKEDRIMYVACLMYGQLTFKDSLLLFVNCIYM